MRIAWLCLCKTEVVIQLKGHHARKGNISLTGAVVTELANVKERQDSKLVLGRCDRLGRLWCATNGDQPSGLLSYAAGQSVVACSSCWGCVWYLVLWSKLGKPGSIVGTLEQIGEARIQYFVLWSKLGMSG